MSLEKCINLRFGHLRGLSGPSLFRAIILSTWDLNSFEGHAETLYLSFFIVSAWNLSTFEDTSS